MGSRGSWECCLFWKIPWAPSYLWALFVPGKQKLESSQGILPTRGRAASPKGLTPLLPPCHELSMLLGLLLKDAALKPSRKHLFTGGRRCCRGLHSECWEGELCRACLWLSAQSGLPAVQQSAFLSLCQGIWRRLGN